MLKIYCDGGLLGINPSGFGGTYAYVIVRHPEETIFDEASGVIDAKHLGNRGFVSNNMSELYALCLAIMRTPEGSEAHFYSDSDNALGRVFRGESSTIAPRWLSDLRCNAIARLETMQAKYTLLAGHPSKAHIAAGWHDAKKLPVSAWNKYCDNACNQARANWEAGRQAFLLEEEGLQRGG